MLPPVITACMNVFVTPLYLLLYSTVHHLSPAAGLFQSATFCCTSSVNGREGRPSCCLSMLHEGCGCVSCERWIWVVGAASLHFLEPTRGGLGRFCSCNGFR